MAIGLALGISVMVWGTRSSPVPVSPPVSTTAAPVTPVDPYERYRRAVANTYASESVLTELGSAMALTQLLPAFWQASTLSMEAGQFHLTLTRGAQGSVGAMTGFYHHFSELVPIATLQWDKSTLDWSLPPGLTSWAKTAADHHSARLNTLASLHQAGWVVSEMKEVGVAAHRERTLQAQALVWPGEVSALSQWLRISIPTIKVVGEVNLLFK